MVVELTTTTSSNRVERTIVSPFLCTNAVNSVSNYNVNLKATVSGTITVVVSPSTEPLTTSTKKQEKKNEFER